MSKTLKYIIIGGVLLIIGLTIASSKGMFGKSETGKKVFVEKVGKVNIMETVTGSGKIQPEKEVKISSDVSGEIIKLPIKEGQAVKKGDLLVKINPDLYQSGLKRARAAVQNTRAGLSQAKSRLLLPNKILNAANNYLPKELYPKPILTKPILTTK